MNKVNWNGLMEYVNDALFTSIFLEIYNRMDVSYSKEYLGDFIEYISTIYIYDLMQSKFGDSKAVFESDKKFLKELRKNNLKISLKNVSTTLDKKINEMGIDFDNYIYDCVICYSGNELYDINFRNWNKNRNTNEYKNFQYRLVYNCRAWIKRIIGLVDLDYDYFINELFNEKIELCKDILQQKNLKKSSYSSYKLFQETILSNCDKIILMHFYGCLKSIMYFHSIFNSLKINGSSGKTLFDSEYFFIKLKAVLIDSIYDALPNQDSVLYDELSNFVIDNIPDDFWKINRKIRRNIHYDDYEEILDSEYDYVKKYQDIYLEELLKRWSSKLNIKIGFWERLFSFISKK